MQPKYPHPQILTIDVDKRAPESLSAAGYNVANGSFGQPYRVEAGNGLTLMTGSSASLPNYSEQDIIVANLAGPNPISLIPEMEDPVYGEPRVWAEHRDGLIDPRAFVMGTVREHSDRILKNGGAFILFCSHQEDAKYIVGKQRGPNYNVEFDSRLSWTNWQILNDLNSITVKHESGRDIRASENEPNLDLTRLITQGTFDCTLRPSVYIQDRWVTLATSKFGEPVAGLICPDDPSGGGYIFLLPQCKNPHEVVLHVINELLPVLSPKLFPHSEKQKWINYPEYELPEVQRLRSQIDEHQKELREKIRGIEEAIELQRKNDSWVQDLLTATGDQLVDAVIRAFQSLGFKDVRNADAERAAVSDTGPLREDIQIHDTSPLLLIEVKGINNLPREAASLQVTKYLAPRMRELNRTDISGVSIVNHQRSLPPLDRVNDQPFQKDVLANAEDQRFGLMTSFDLYRIVRAARQYGWKAENVCGLFYESGRIQAVPQHYEFIGTVQQYFEKHGVVTIALDESVVLYAQDRIAFELSIEWFEETAESLQIDNKKVVEVKGGQEVAIKSAISRIHAKKGVRVFRIKGANDASAVGI